MIGIELCPHCGSKQHTGQPDSHRQSQVIFYECGNSITFNFGQHGELISHEDHSDCENKIDWTNILTPYDDEFDRDAKAIDERFMGWIELQFYQTYHNVGWKNKHTGRNCNDKEFLDKYFLNKELYLRSVRDDNNNVIYQRPSKQTFVKDYPEFTGLVTVEEVHKSIINDIETVLYRVLSSETSQEHVGGYVVEKRSVLGEDHGRYFYERDIINIIKKEEI